MIPCSDVVGYQCFEELYYLHLQGETLSYHFTTLCHNPEDRDMNLHGRENQKPRNY